MNKFIKYPLFLGIVGAVCSFMLAAVYGFTSPIINERLNNETNAAITELYPSATSVKNVSSDYNDLKESGISIIYEIKTGSNVTAYGYQAATTGYGGTITNLIIISATENKIEAFKNISHTETKGAKYGDVLLSSPDFADQFVGLEFDKVATDIDFAGGSTAAITLNAVKQCVQNVINYHLVNVKGEEVIEVTEEDFAHLGLTGASFISKFDEYKNLVGNRVDRVLTNTGITNYYEAVDSAGNIIGYAYYLNYEYEAYENGIQKVKALFGFDANGQNTVLWVKESNDSFMGAPYYDKVNKPIGTTLVDSVWLNQFNDKDINVLLKDFLVSEDWDDIPLDKEAGLTKTTETLASYVKWILYYHNSYELGGIK